MNAAVSMMRVIPLTALWVAGISNMYTGMFPDGSSNSEAESAGDSIVISWNGKAASSDQYTGPSDLFHTPVTLTGKPLRPPTAVSGIDPARRRVQSSTDLELYDPSTQQERNHGAAYGAEAPLQRSKEEAEGTTNDDPSVNLADEPGDHGMATNRSPWLANALKEEKDRKVDGDQEPAAKERSGNEPSGSG
ncbi:hypothetical protein QFC21_003489 [Naganishia friedmannii]|uniref:Uncharacterized protein n=1 Tax=Naganishia friedmannii TaxID=89922 RepID=A0ACC2VQ99_9TREE|nr:hypothetical protein QFC21_003489 [Naganishia friedmannii]